jgi:chaperonin GroES
MKVRPLHDRVLVKRVESEEKTAGGLYIPASAQEKQSQGIVLAVGEGNRDEKGGRITLDVKVNDRVLFSKYGGTEVKIGGEDRIILREEDIQAIIED